jgi:hypothetical protein
LISNSRIYCFKRRCLRDVTANHRFAGLRRAVARPIYVLALVLGLLSDALGVLAAKIAGDE